MKNSIIRLMSLLILPFVMLTTSCNLGGQVDDFEQIKERGTLKVVTGYSPISYFVYRGQPMGYEYELLSILAEHLGVSLQLEVARSLDQMIEKLENGDVDMIAHNLTVTRSRAERVAFTLPLHTTRQVLVQKKPDNWRQMRLHEIDQDLIRNPIELAGKTVHVRSGSAYISRIESLSDEIGGEIDVRVADQNLTTEELITMVASGEISFTIADENIAKINQSYLSILDVDTPVSLPQQLAWAINKKAPDLLNEVNKWISEMQMGSDYYAIYNKYFENRRGFRERASSDLVASRSGRISEFDEIIKKYAEEIDWDWRLMASLIYQESQFNPNARSWAGAVGLMQLMPRTARAHGAQNPRIPEQNIRAGADFISWLNNYWEDKIPDEHERIKFILASYNVGHGHVQDARRLADKFGANPNVWENNVARYMLKKSNAEYYNDEVVQFGYARGAEPVNYVNSIFYIYSHYQQISDNLIESNADDRSISVN